MYNNRCSFLYCIYDPVISNEKKESVCIILYANFLYLNVLGVVCTAEIHLK